MNKVSEASSLPRLSLIAKKHVGESLLKFQYPSSSRRDSQPSALRAPARLTANQKTRIEPSNKKEAATF